VDRLSVLLLLVPLVVAIGLGYSILLLWRRKSARSSTNPGGGFRPKIGFTRLDGMASLALLLSNHSKAFVWVEEVEIFLADLRTDEDQAASEPSCTATLKIRQMLRPQDAVPISLAASLYKAAGEPQRRYSCVLSSIVRYRIGEEWSEKNLDVYRVQMMGLIAARLRRERGFVPQQKTRDKSPDPRGSGAAK